MITKNDIPSEVWEAVCIAQLGVVGMELFNRHQEIVKKYPEHFPWETKYNSIPNEVHKAFSTEINGGTFEEILARATSNPIHHIEHNREYISKPINIREVFNNVLRFEEDRRERAEQREKENKKVWDKHYSKYNLPYRGI